MKRYSNIICQNCGNKGHHLKQCTQPKYSYGIILYKKEDDIIKYLMICRRNTIGFVQFIRGQYINSDIDYIQTLFNVMTENEISAIKNKNFDNLWELLWLDRFYKKENDKIRKDKESSLKKFLDMSEGYISHGKFINLHYFINNKTQIYQEPEWEFPKGRRNSNENNINTASREFTEETGIDIKDIHIDNSCSYQENYKSYDNINYCNKYFIGNYIGNQSAFNITSSIKEQYTEVSNIQFFSYDEVLSHIRDYCQYKKKLISDINTILKNK